MCLAQSRHGLRDSSVSALVLAPYPEPNCNEGVQSPSKVQCDCVGCFGLDASLIRFKPMKIRVPEITLQSDYDVMNLSIPSSSRERYFCSHGINDALVLMVMVTLLTLNYPVITINMITKGTMIYFPKSPMCDEVLTVVPSATLVIISSYVSTVGGLYLI